MLTIYHLYYNINGKWNDNINGKWNDNINGKWTITLTVNGR